MLTEERRREKKRTGGLREGRGGECSEVAFHAVREMIYKKRVWLREQNQSSVFFGGGGGDAIDGLCQIQEERLEAPASCPPRSSNNSVTGRFCLYFAEVVATIKTGSTW